MGLITTQQTRSCSRIAPTFMEHTANRTGQNGLEKARESHPPQQQWRAKPKGSICSLYKWADAAFLALQSKAGCYETGWRPVARRRRRSFVTHWPYMSKQSALYLLYQYHACQMTKGRGPSFIIRRQGHRRIIQTSDSWMT